MASGIEDVSNDSLRNQLTIILVFVCQDGEDYENL
jgi:hypothetical protein